MLKDTYIPNQVHSELSNLGGSLGGLFESFAEAMKGHKIAKDVKLKVYREDPSVPMPRVAYNGTSAAFDIAASGTTTIPANSRVNVPTGIKISIDQHDPYYMQIHLRSSLGFKHGLRCHIGIVDAGYTGDFGVSVVNNTSGPYTINAGDYFAQVLVLKKPTFEFEELTAEQWSEYEKCQERGEGGFGSSGKQ